ncbi:DEAD/DEAH box helicase [Priestia aryabhattai]
MNEEKATAILERLESDSFTQNLIAQSDSRYILFNVKEPIKNFPNYTEGLDEQLTSTAISYLSVGCTYAEHMNINQAIFPLEKGATILENIYSPIANRNDYSSYFILTSSLAFYAAHQYSKSFILLKGVQFDTIISELISNFLRRQYSDLDKLLSEVFLSDNYHDKTLAAIDDAEIANNRIYILILSKSLSSLLEFIFSGDNEWLDKAKDYLTDLLELLSIDSEPSLWWVIRLLKIIIDGFQENSLWNAIPPHLDNEDERVKKYIAAMAFQKSPVVELFHSQKVALPQVLNERGAVVSLPTSAGKTRIAEIAILDCLTNNPDSKVLYLAPFKSLAFEVEDSLSKVFESLGFEVSQLYGGTQFSKLDEMLINESNVIISTAEKAKAILRSNSEIKSEIQLIIIDEGHLLGPKERYILSEMLIEELRFYINRNQGKMLLLSAVLPNADEIASWLTGNKEMKVTSNWRPSTQRLGLLEYTGNNVNIRWKGKVESFNSNFIEPFIVKRPRSEYTFPRDKKQAIAAATLKLCLSGSVLIFVCRKIMVLPQAKEVIAAMGEKKELHTWSATNDWNVFKLACEEAYGKESVIYEHAKYGVLCHHSGLPTEVRLSMEKLMRKDTPKVIVATSTLGQGVNIGVSTVIIANVWYDKENKITSNDFWNIVGRAGRSFIDSEGKVLYVVDASKGLRKANRNRKIALEYFKNKNQDKAISGLLYIVYYIYKIAQASEIDFHVLLQMIAENNYSALEKDVEEEFINLFDWIDDTLLALNLEFESYNELDASSWIDNHFRDSLAYIQATHFQHLDGETVISFLKARNEGVLNLAGEPDNWNGLVSSSIPLRSALYIKNEINSVLEALSKYQTSEKNIISLLSFVEDTETIISRFPSKQFANIDIPEKIRDLWMRGQSINTLDEKERELCSDYFGFTLPWGISAISRMLYTMNMQDEAKEFEDLGVLVQMGLPNMFAAKIYLTGIQSRVAAKELSDVLNPVLREVSIRRLRSEIISRFDSLTDITSNTLQWLTLLKILKPNISFVPIRVPNFTLKDHVKVSSNTLSVKQYKDSIFLCSPDYNDKIKIKLNNKIPLGEYSNNLSVYFLNNNTKWVMKSRNPYLKINL